VRRTKIFHKIINNLFLSPLKPWVLLPNYPQLQKQQTIFTTILDRNALPIHKTQVPNLDIVPSHILLSNTDVELTTAIDHREERLKRELDLIKHNYDYIFIDCPLPYRGLLSMR
jgi:chromosome partitioning protein